MMVLTTSKAYRLVGLKSVAIAKATLQDERFLILWVLLQQVPVPCAHAHCDLPLILHHVRLHCFCHWPLHSA